ncbi:MAG: hypothetical protein VKJ24_22290 [Synechococcales bacterium]|nr:hypothetical protein [Synechococcales bacterium]
MIHRFRVHLRRPSIARFSNLIVSASLLQVLCWVPMPAIAQTPLQARVQEILDGNEVFIRNRLAKKNDVGREGEVVRTGVARTSLFFTAKAGVRMAQRSSLSIGSDCVRLVGGKAIVAGTLGRNGCVGKLVVVNKKTVYLMQFDQKNNPQIIVLEGEVEVLSTDAPDSRVTLTAGQGVTATEAGTLPTTPTGTIVVTQFSTSQMQNQALPIVQGFQVPLPDLEKVAFLQPNRTGFATTFLRDALLGREGFFEEWDSQKGESVASFTPGTSSDFGVFIRDTNTTGRFIGSLGVVPIAVNFDDQTISIGGTTGIANSVGLSGNNARGTVTLSDGTAIRLEVFGVNKQEPPIGQPFSGTLSVGTPRDR